MEGGCGAASGVSLHAHAVVWQAFDTAAVMSLAGAAQVGHRVAVQIRSLLRGWDHRLDARV